MAGLLKRIAAYTLVGLGVDRRARTRNRHRLLTVMYHGITRHRHDPPVWTQLPEAIFRRQIAFLKRHYHPVSLQDVVDAVVHDASLPERAVLVTFDDGLRNNATVAWPILRQFRVPAVIFLTVDFVDSDRFLWTNELYFYIATAARSRIPLRFAECPTAESSIRQGKVWDAYLDVVAPFKQMSAEQRSARLNALATTIPIDRSRYAADFGMLKWEQVIAMNAEGLIDFGVHTATHQILTQMDPLDAGREIIASKQTLERRLGRPVVAFCYPDGTFRAEHQRMLQRGGYCCAFAAGPGLFRPHVDDAFAIHRIAAGHDLSSHPAVFRLATAGVRRPHRPSWRRSRHSLDLRHLPRQVQ